MTMQNICILIYTIIMSIHLKSVHCKFVGENQPESDYRLRLQQPLFISRDTSHLLSDDARENWLDLYKNKEKCAPALRERNDIILNSDSDNNINNNDNDDSTFQSHCDDDAVRLLVDSYFDLLRKNRKLTYEDNKYDRDDKPVTYEKRALTMLSRWKPFRIPNSISGNGRHVIRSPLTSRSEPSESFNKMQIMGRPFRWG